MAIASGDEGVGSAKAEPVRRLSWLAAADLGALWRRRAPGGLVGPKVGTPAVPRMGPTRRLQPPGVALSEARAPNAQKGRSTREARGAATSWGCGWPGQSELPSPEGVQHPQVTGVRAATPRGCGPPDARRPRSDLKSTAAKDPNAASPHRPRCPDAPRPRSDLKSTAANDQDAASPHRLRRHNARRPRSDLKSAAANQSRRRAAVLASQLG